VRARACVCVDVGEIAGKTRSASDVAASWNTIDYDVVCRCICCHQCAELTVIGGNVVSANEFNDISAFDCEIPRAQISISVMSLNLNKFTEKLSGRKDEFMEM
jgi:hypothetical protein